MASVTHDADESHAANELAGAAPHLMGSAPNAEAIIDGRRVLYFAGTGYLGLAADPSVIDAGCRAMQQYGVHSATVRTGYGTTPPVLDVERLAARLLDAEDAAYLVSGYLAPAALAAALADRFDVAYLDEHAHYSIADAIAPLNVPVHRFAHRDAGDLAVQLTATLPPRARPLVFTDGVFAVTGAIAPVADYVNVLAEYDAPLLALDDAHALGVLGPHGRGTLEHAGADPHSINRDFDEPAHGVRLFHCATLSKAIGGHGGIVAGSSAFIARLRHAGHAYHAASCPAAPVAAASAQALELVIAHPELRTRLHANVARLKYGLRSLGLPGVDDSPAPIVGLQLGDAARMHHIQRTLLARDIAIAYIPRYTGFPSGAGGLRIAVFATHTDAMIDRLLTELAKIL